MTTSELVKAYVHVAGPCERESDCLVQRCLRCDELLAMWPGRDEPPSNAYRVGRRVAADAYQGISASRYAVDERDLRCDEQDCSPTPPPLL